MSGPRRPPRPAPAGTGPNRPPRPAAPSPQPARGTAARSDPPTGRSKVPPLPGPRGEPRRRAAPTALERPATSGIRFRPPKSGPVDLAPTPEAVPAPNGRVPGPGDPATRAAHLGLSGRVAAVVHRRPAVDPATVLPTPPTPRTAFRRRYGVPYDTQGPRLRIGVLWALSVAVALAFRPLRPYGLATLYGVVAGLAAVQVVDAWNQVRAGADRWVAALTASALPVVATLGVGPVGGVLIATVVVAVAAATRRPNRGLPLFSAAGHTVLAAGVCGGATAALVLLADYEIGAVIILVVLVMAYDACDYLVGSGADNGIEGPLAGMLFMAAITSVLAVLNVPPFRGVDIWSFAVLAMVACPAGQLLASAMLPRGDVRAPALRRLDSLLLAAPAWAALVGLYLQHVT